MKQWQDLHKRAAQYYDSENRKISLPHDIVHALTTALSSVAVYDAWTETRPRLQLRIMIGVTLVLFVANFVQIFLFRLMAALNYKSLQKQHLDRAADFARVSNKCQRVLMKLHLISNSTAIVATLDEIINMKAELDEQRGTLQFPTHLREEEQGFQSSETYVPIYNDVESQTEADLRHTIHTDTGVSGGLHATIHSPVMIPSTTGIIVEHLDDDAAEILFETQESRQGHDSVKEGIEMMRIPRQKADVGNHSVFLNVLKHTTQALHRMRDALRDEIVSMQASQRKTFMWKVILAGLRVIATSIFGMNVAVGSMDGTTTTSRVAGIAMGALTMSLYIVDAVNKMSNVDDEVLVKQGENTQLQGFLTRVNRAAVETPHDAVARRQAFVLLLMFKAELGSSLQFDADVLDVFNISAYENLQPTSSELVATSTTPAPVPVPVPAPSAPPAPEEEEEEDDDEVKGKEEDGEDEFIDYLM
jgi:hypothetical protein